MNKPSFCILLILLTIFLSACSSTVSNLPPELQVTLDSMVQGTLVASDPTETNVPTSLPTEMPTPTTTPEPVLPTVTSTPEKVSEDNIVTIDTYTPTATPESVLACLNRMKAVNVRELPDLDAPRIDIMEITECTNIIETTEDFVWGKNEKGWIPLEFLDLANKLDRLPIFKGRNP